MADWLGSDRDRVVSVLFYSVQFNAELDDALALVRARALILEPVHGYTPEEEYEAIGASLRTGSPLADLIPSPLPVPHSEQEHRDFAQRVLDHMDALRPWPELPFISLREAPWHDYAESRVIARIRMNEMRVTERLHRHLAQVREDERLRHWLTLRLNSGDEVALAEPWWPDSEHVAVLSRRGADKAPEAVLAAFLHVTGFTLDEIDDLTDGVDPLSRGGAGTGWLAYTLRRDSTAGGIRQGSFGAFQRARLYCEAMDKPGVVAVGPPGKGLVPAFTSPEALAHYVTAKGSDVESQEPRYFSTLGADLLGLLPDGYAVLVDPGEEYAAAFDRNGPR
ncbi:SseB family protein [Nonomuraea sp. NPDC049714]|uniref:SseB family protein n=1 Tax=Nonomuraea sp. NPDC049714 TaxID=3364357 RepID=UPI0037B814AA